MRRLDVRIYIVLASCAVAGSAAAGCGENRNPVAPSAAPLSLTNSAGVHKAVGVEALEGAEASHVPEAADVAVGPELAAVRRATAAFHRPENAMNAGYVFDEPCVESPAGGMGIHTPNPPLIANQALDPAQPELLLYQPTDGGLRLVGVEYLQVVLLRNTATGQIGPWFSSSSWPSSYEVVTPTPALFGQTFNGPMPGHNPSMPWHWDLHVWIWAHNPSGMFAQWNPALQCGGDSNRAG
jgi:hypothetical protein